MLRASLLAAFNSILVFRISELAIVNKTCFSSFPPQLYRLKMMYARGLLLVMASSLTLTTSFQVANFGSRISTRSSQISMSDVPDLSEEVDYKSLVVSGFVSKENNFAESFTLSKLFKTGKWSEITTVTDDLKFARKRIVSPDSVYSGLMDVLKFAVVDTSDEGKDASLEAALTGNEAWLSFNVTAEQLPSYATIAVKAGVKRAVFAVYVGSDQSGEGVTFDSACGILQNANIDYTIIKFGPVKKMAESKVPFRLVRGELALPTEGGILSSEDLMRVLSEVVDIPKTFNNVYGIGPGTKLDAEISVYMKSQGWPVRVQVGMLVGDMMEKIQSRYDEEQKSRASKSLLPIPKKVKNDYALPTEGEGNKFAGFF